MNFKPKKITKSLVLFLCVSFFMTTFSLGFLTPKKVEAQAYVPVWETGLNLTTNLATTEFAGMMDWKEFVADGVVWEIVKKMVKNKVIDEVLDKVSELSGGNPAFIQDPFGTLKGLEKHVAVVAIDNVLLTDLNDIDAWFGTDIEAILKNSHTPSNTDDRLDEIFKPSIEDVVNADGDFNDFKAGNFYQGGWKGFFSLTQNPKNNAYGSYFLAENAVAQAQTDKESSLLNELNWGDGFMSVRDGGLITLPGQSLSTQLNESLSNELRTLENADEITEAVALLAGALIDNIFDGGGLVGGGYMSVSTSDTTTPSRPSGFAPSAPGGGSTVSISTGIVLDIDNGSFLLGANFLHGIDLSNTGFMDMEGTPTNYNPDSTIKVGTSGHVSIPSLTFVANTGTTVTTGSGSIVNVGEIITLSNVTVSSPSIGTLSSSQAQNTDSTTNAKVIEEIAVQANVTGANLTNVTLELDSGATSDTDYMDASVTSGVGNSIANLTNITSISTSDGTSFPGDMLRGGRSSAGITLDNVRLLGGTVSSSATTTIYSISNPSDNLYCETGSGSYSSYSLCNYNHITSGVNGSTLYINDSRDAWAIKNITWTVPRQATANGLNGFEIFGGTVVGP